ncbi:protein rolling stone-like [Vanessa atalanta]|uniref:protein rolling stone-like n=1 Tax=Vanessa atalanta TaxID=42275 RepID=UPI001FCD71FB|nr:protein rolling stone-like [Vanessa atalanta]XP_047541821.1 protein rolling stone-like [Vanessa atalanta]
MVKRIGNKFTLSDLWVTSNEKLSDFYLTSWQRGDSAVPMLLVRLFLSMVTVGILVWSLISGASPYWLIYLTNWGLLLVTSLTLSSLLVSCLAVGNKLPDGGNLPWYVSLYWLLYNITVSIAIMITALYWILLFSPEIKAEQTPAQFWLDVATHGFNSCVAFVEVILSRTPLHFVHIYQPLGIGLWYAMFSAIYYLAGGTDSIGNPFIYEVLDWRQSDRAGVIVAISAASLIMLYTALWGLSICRDKLSTLLIRTTSLSLPLTPPDRHTATGIV